jgi:hypothetical protein
MHIRLQGGSFGADQDRIFLSTPAPPTPSLFRSAVLVSLYSPHCPLSLSILSCQFDALTPPICAAWHRPPSPQSSHQPRKRSVFFFTLNRGAPKGKIKPLRPSDLSSDLHQHPNARRQRESSALHLRHLAADFSKLRSVDSVAASQSPSQRF